MNEFVAMTWLIRLEYNCAIHCSHHNPINMTTDNERYAVHNPLEDFVTAEGVNGSTISGYQPVCRVWPLPNGSHPPHARYVMACNRKPPTDKT